MTKQEEILTNLLDCGTEDLKLLEDIEYDLYDILEYLKECGSFNINSIFREVFKKGAIDLNYAFIEHKEEIREQILEEIQTIKEEYPDYDLEKDEDYQELVNDLDLLDNKKLNPMEDLDYYLNWQDTHVYMEHIEFYIKYMPDVVDTIETNMGWEFKQGGTHMYTVLWRENDNDKCDRFETKEEVKNLIDELEKNPDVCENDIWIFTPEADNHAVEYDMF